MMTKEEEKFDINYVSFKDGKEDPSTIRKIGTYRRATVKDYQKNLDSKFTDLNWVIANLDRISRTPNFNSNEPSRVVYRIVEKEYPWVRWFNKLFKRKTKKEPEPFTLEDLGIKNFKSGIDFNPDNIENIF